MHDIGSVRAVKSGGGSLIELQAIPRSDREKNILHLFYMFEYNPI